MQHLRALFLATSVVTGLVLAGCGDDDDGQGTNVTPDGGDPTPTDDGGPNPQIDGGDPDAPNTSSLPAYVKSLIDTKTADNSLPDPETVWGAIPDDETPATAAALFPPAYFQ